MNYATDRFNSRIHAFGRISIVISLVLFFLPAVGLSVIYEVPIHWGDFGKALAPVFTLFFPIAVAELVTYYPIIGGGAAYLVFITGNLTSMKIPATISGMKIAKVEPGSREGNIIAILASGASAVITTLILFLGMLFLARFLAPLLSDPMWKPAFENVMPALFGALSIPRFRKDPKQAVLPFAGATAAALFMGYPVFLSKRSYVLIGLMILTSAQAYYTYKKQQAGQAGQ